MFRTTANNGGTIYAHESTNLDSAPSGNPLSGELEKQGFERHLFYSGVKHDRQGMQSNTWTARRRNGNVKGFRSLCILTLLSLSLLVARFIPSLPINDSLDRLQKFVTRSGLFFQVDNAQDAVIPLAQKENQYEVGGLTDQVQFDNYSLILRGQRIFLQ